MTQSKTVLCNYIKEEWGRETVEFDYGFYSYQFFKETGEFLVGDMYVVPEKRGKGLSILLGNAAEKHARDLGANHLSCIISIKPSATRLIKGYILFGFAICDAKNGQIIMIKELN